MRTAAAGFPIGARVLRRQIALAVIGGAALTVFLAMTFLGLSMTAVFVGAALTAAAAATILYPEVGLFALVLNALIGLTHVTELPRLGPLSVPIAFEGVLLLALVLQVAIGRRRLNLATPQHLLLLGLTFWIVVSLLINGHVTEENLDAIRNLYLVRVLVFVLVTSLIDSESSLRRLVGILAVSNVGLLLVSVGTRLGFFGAEKVVVSEKMLRTSALVHNPNTLAFELTTMLIIAVFAFLEVKRRWLRALLLALAGANGMVILSTLSRSGFISLAAVLLFMFFKLTRSAKVVALILILGVLGGFLSMTNLAKRFGRLNEIRDVDRFQIAVVGFNAASANPIFGVGIGNFLRDFERYDTVDAKRALPAHNMYLDLAAQMGLPALLFYLGIVAVTWTRLARMERDLRARGEEASFLSRYGLAVQCFLVNLCVFGLSGDVEFEYSVFIMIGVGIILERLRRRAAGAAAGPICAPRAGPLPRRAPA